MKLKTIVIVAFIGLCCNNNMAQDIHFSQTLAMPLYLNPALTGYFDAHHRYAINFRNQWASITTPFQTFTASYDTKMKARRVLSAQIGLGFFLYRDKAGDSDFGTTQVQFPMSVTKNLNNKGTHFIAFGLAPSVAFRGFDTKELRFDDQFDGIQFNSSLKTNEVINEKKISYADFNTGVHWGLLYNSNWFHNIGISISHFNRPKVSYFQDKAIRLYTKFTLYGFSRIVAVQNKLTTIPTLVYSSQGTHQELLFGVTSKYFFKNSNYSAKPYALIVGMHARFNDAVILISGVEMEHYLFQFSYDINYSPLKRASQSMGGPELSFIYTNFNKKKKTPTKVPCPIF